MIEGKLIGVDVDLTVVDTLTPWIKWYEKLTGHNIFKDISHKLYGIEELMKEHKDPLEFWKSSTLYDNLIPIEGSVKTLECMSNKNDVVFISSCFPEHIKSKEYFLNRNFPFHKGFISTSQKEFIQCDYYIDDYSKYLRNMKNRNVDCHCMMFESPLNTKDLEFERVNWNSIMDKLCAE
jgi:5'(3')-deoxyribonucleotidase